MIPNNVQDLLKQLGEANAAVHREVLDVLMAFQGYGEDTVRRWMDAVRRIFNYDSEAGRVFVASSREVERISETVLPWTEQTLMFLRWPGATPAIAGFIRNLPRAYGMLGHAGEKRWMELGLNWYSRQADSGREYFTTPVPEFANHQGIVGIEQLIEPIEMLFESRKLMLSTCLGGAIRVRNLLGADAVLPWATRGADIMLSGRARGEAYFKLENEESLAVLMDRMPGYRAGDHNRLMTLLLDVWFERDFEFKEGSWSPEKGRPFVETDGRSVFIPAVMPDREEAILAVLHAGGHMAYGSHDRDAVSRIFASMGVQLPRSGPVAWAPVFERYGDDVLRFQLLFDLCEDLRVDYRVQQMVPNYLMRLQAAARERRRRAPESLVYYDEALASVSGAVAVIKGGGGNLDGRLLPLLAPEATIADAFRIANELYRDTTLPIVTDADTFCGAYLPGRSPNAARAINLESGRNPQSQSQPGEKRESPDGDDGAQAEDGQDGEPEGAEQAEREKLNAVDGESAGSDRRMMQRPQMPASADKGENKGKPYPEWDYREGRYKRNWSWVQEKPLAESNLAEAEKLINQYSGTLKQLKKAIQAQKPTRLAPKIRQFDGDEIDLNAVVTYVTERRAGYSPLPAIYRRREVKQRDVSVTLLADMSTSIMQHLPEGGGRLVDRVRAGVLLFAESMEEVGDAYSIAGFCSKYRDNVCYYTIKDFEDPFTMQVKSVIGGLSGRLATRMGAAIRHATSRFEGVESRRRLLLILSDGRPEDYDDGGDRRYLHEDTRMAVKEAVACGVHPFCITVDTMANQYLPQIFGPGHYMVLDRINSLPSKLPEIYLRLRR